MGVEIMKRGHNYTNSISCANCNIMPLCNDLKRASTTFVEENYPWQKLKMNTISM